MVPIFYDISHKLRDAISKKVSDGPLEVEMVSWMSRTALELIGQTGLGFSFDSLTEDEATHPYAKAVKGFIPAVHKLRFIFPFVPSLYQLGSATFRRFVVDAIPWKALHEARDLVDLMARTSWEIYEEKKKALADGDEALITKVGQGKDIMSILMRANMSASKEESLTEVELLGQMTTLIFAAMDTTSNALSRILHLLATHLEVQDRLRREIAEARENNGGEDVSYDKLVLLPYLDAICRETLRLHPSVTSVQRTAMQDVVLPLSSPVKGLDGKELHEIHVPKGTNITISILAANRNPDIWGPDAEEWKPDRWLAPLPESVINAHLPGIYSHLLTFIGGSRACIGFNFSQLEMKVVLFMLIESFRFSPSKQEIIWEMNGITSPNVKGGDGKFPLMPLLVERI
jgi:cytochrome P450